MPIYTALTAPADSFPSLNNVAWSDDGQLLLLTRGTIYILTPDLGIFFDAVSATASRPKATKAADKIVPSPAAKDLDAELKCRKPVSGLPGEHLAVGFLVPSLSICTWMLFSGHSHFKSRTQPVGSGEKLLERSMDEGLAWSKLPRYDVTPQLIVDGSLLAVGTRAGTVILMRVEPEAPQLKPVHTIQVSDSWVTLIAWSSWESHADGSCIAVIACALADGTVRRIRVRQKLHTSTTDMTTPATVSYQQDIATVGLPNGPAYEFDDRIITGAQWIDTFDDKSMLIFTKSGTVTLWSELLGFRTLRIQRQQIANYNSSPFLPPVGFIYLGVQDVLLLILSDSSFHVIHQASTVPSFSDTATTHDDTILEELLPQLHSRKLSQNLRSAAAMAEQSSTSGRRIHEDDLIENCGLTTFDDFGTVLWYHERQRPQDLDYIGPSKHRGQLVVTPLWHDDPSGDGLVGHIFQILQSTKIVAPVSILRSAIFQLRHPQRYVVIRDRLKTMLELPVRAISTDTAMVSQEGEGEEDTQGPEDGEVPTHVQNDFRDRVAETLAMDVETVHAQLKFNLAHACWKYHKDVDFEAITVLWSRKIHEIRLRRLMEAFGSVSQWLAATDRAFACRMAAQAILFSNDTRMDQLAWGLMHSLKLQPPKMTLRSSDDAVNTTSSTRLSGAAHLGESCPACHADVAMEDIVVASCANGHIWGMA
ncbi:hypothetical protein FRB97_002402 [Tulasnella sp. 331]|nr:hypothetical protein FRB97_002402 [Tulasnella sp. 331]